MLKALRNTLIYNLGSVALGSFIIAIIQFVRVSQTLSLRAWSAGHHVSAGHIIMLGLNGDSRGRQDPVVVSRLS